MVQIQPTKIVLRDLRIPPTEVGGLFRSKLFTQKAHETEVSFISLGPACFGGRILTIHRLPLVGFRKVTSAPCFGWICNDLPILFTRIMKFLPVTTLVW